MERLVIPDEMKVGAANRPATVEENISKAGAGRVIRIICWLIVIGGVAIGGLILFAGMSQAQSAPQEAVVITLALACAILPYCLARAITEITRDS